MGRQPLVPCDDDYRSFAEDGCVLVAERDGALAGVVGVPSPHSHHARVAGDDEAEIARLATLSAAHRSGVARSLMSQAEKEARADGRTALVLWSRSGQRAGQTLYQSLGFERIPDRDFVDRDEPSRAYGLALT
jgi:ribosomal protein S18 acetylase RimI-like enzyme